MSQLARVGVDGPAAQLFAERTEAVGMPVESADDAAVARVVGALDGLPLAIELAAARLPDVGLAGLVETTSSFLDVLTEGERDLPSRQRTLRTALSWSHDLLEEDEKRVFARLAVFAGNIPAAGVEPVCGPGSQVSMLVLESKSLLQVDGERLLMLEPIRQLAAEHLAESGELDTCARAPQEWFVSFAENADRRILVADQAAWLKRLADQPDVRPTSIAPTRFNSHRLASTRSDLSAPTWN